MRDNEPTSPKSTPSTQEENEARRRLSRMRGQAIENKTSSVAHHDDPLTAALKKDLQRRRGKASYNFARPLSSTIYKSVYPVLKGKDSGAALTSIIQRWPEIVGKNIAELCIPIKISKPPTGYVLVLETYSAAAALKLKHQGDLILEKVNAASGATFKGLHLQQTQTHAFDAGSKTPKLRKRLTQEQFDELSNSLAHIDSASIRQALFKLGEAMLTKKEPPPSPTNQRLRRLKSRPPITRR